VELAWETRGASVVLVVRRPAGGAAGTAAPARVYPAGALRDGRAPGAGPAMAGRWEAGPGPGEQVFVPRFPFLAATSYVVVDGPGPDGEPISASIAVPPVGGAPTTSVLGIEPAVAVVPRNLLRLHVRFSAPMSEGRAAGHVRLLRSTGEPVPGALLSLDPELWDPQRRRLTVLLDPARIKRGLVPHREAGYPLVEGEVVRLAVDAGFPDAAGRGLRSGAESAFEVGPDLRGLVRPARWRVDRPRAGSLDPLRLHFDRTLDRPLADRCIRLPGVPGSGAASPDGASWRFDPAGPWAPGAVDVVVDPRLEDVAGNAVARPFDRDLSRPDDDPLDPDEVPTIRVAIAPAGD